MCSLLELDISELLQAFLLNDGQKDGALRQGLTATFRTEGVWPELVISVIDGQKSSPSSFVRPCNKELYDATETEVRAPQIWV